jgi:hypothetical protein
MSGQCCAQDPATLPAHGKIGYTGNSLCEDGYVGEYEQRPNTDGKDLPGFPGITSLTFLTASRPAGSAGSTAGGGGAALETLTSNEYSPGRMPRPAPFT